MPWLKLQVSLAAAPHLRSSIFDPGRHGGLPLRGNNRRRAVLAKNTGAPPRTEAPLVGFFLVSGETSVGIRNPDREDDFRRHRDTVLLSRREAPL